MFLRLLTLISISLNPKWRFQNGWLKCRKQWYFFRKLINNHNWYFCTRVDDVNNVDDSSIDVCENNGNPINAHKNSLHRYDNLIRDLYAHSTSGSLIRANYKLTFLSFRPSHRVDRAPSTCVSRAVSLVLATVAKINAMQISRRAIARS